MLIIGEYLLNFHPGANHDIEAFLEQNGFEIIEARMSDVIQKSYFYRDMQVREYHLNIVYNHIYGRIPLESCPVLNHT